MTRPGHSRRRSFAKRRRSFCTQYNDAVRKSSIFLTIGSLDVNCRLLAVTIIEQSGLATSVNGTVLFAVRMSATWPSGLHASAHVRNSDIHVPFQGSFFVSFRFSNTSMSLEPTNATRVTAVMAIRLAQRGKGEPLALLKFM